MSPPERPTAQIVEFVKYFWLALKSCALYATSHPSASRPLSLAFEHARCLVDEMDGLAVAISKDGLRVGATPLGSGNPHARSLRAAMLSQGVARIVVSKGVERGDFERFMQILSLPAAKLAEGGGLSQRLESAKVVNPALIFFGLRSTSADEASEGGGGLEALPMLPEMAAFLRYLRCEDAGLGAFEERFTRELRENPAFVAQVIEKLSSDPSIDRHPIAAQLRALDRVMQALQRAGVDEAESAEALVRVVTQLDPSQQWAIARSAPEIVAAVAPRLIAALPLMLPELTARWLLREDPSGQFRDDRFGREIEAILARLPEGEKLVDRIESRHEALGGSASRSYCFFEKLRWQRCDPAIQAERMVKTGDPWEYGNDAVRSTIGALTATGRPDTAVALIDLISEGLRRPDADARAGAAGLMGSVVDLLRTLPAPCEVRTRSAAALEAAFIREKTPALARALVGSLAAVLGQELAEGHLRCSARQISGLSLNRDPAGDGDWKNDLLLATLDELVCHTPCEPLIEALQNGSSPEVREAAQVLVPRLGPAFCRHLIEALLREQDQRRRAVITDALRLAGTAAEAPIFTFLRRGRARNLRDIVILLGDLRSVKSIPVLRSIIMTDGDRRTRLAAVAALLKIGSSTAHETIADVLELGSAECRQDILRVCRYRPPDWLDETLLRMINPGSSGEGGGSLRLTAIETAGQIRLDRATPFLRDILRTRRFLGMAEGPHTRRAALRALGMISSEEALSALADAADTDPDQDIREEAKTIIRAKA